MCLFYRLQSCPYPVLGPDRLPRLGQQHRGAKPTGSGTQASFPHGRGSLPEGVPDSSGHALLPRGEPGRLAVSRPGASARTSSPRGHLPGAEPARQCRLCHFLSGSFPDHIPIRGRRPSVRSYNALSPSRSPPGVSHLRLIIYVSAPLTEVGGLTAEAECCPSSHS